jgi:hypothetical protein
VRIRAFDELAAACKSKKSAAIYRRGLKAERFFLNVDKPLAEKSPRPGHSRVTAIHQNTMGLPSFEGYKVPL